MYSTRVVSGALSLLLVMGAAACSKKKSEAGQSQGADQGADKGEGKSEGTSDQGPGIARKDLWIETTRTSFQVHEAWGQDAVEVKSASENKVEPEADLAKLCKGQVSARENVDAAGSSDEFISVTYSCQDDTGIGHYAMSIPDQRSNETYEIKYELMNTVHMGQAWSSEHNDSNGKDLRSCQVRSSRYCDDGVSTVCVTEKTGGAMTWLRQNYCKGQGWRGYELVMVRAGAVAMRGWSSDVVADGVKFENLGDPTDLPSAEAVVADAKLIVEAAGKAH